MKNMSIIMKEAHKMTKEIKREFTEVDYKFQLGLCMSYLLNKKEMVELEGTEKQVKWALDIREKMINEAKELKEMYLKADDYKKISMLRFRREALKKEGERVTYREMEERFLYKIDEIVSIISSIKSAAVIINFRIYNTDELIEKRNHWEENKLRELMS